MPNRPHDAATTGWRAACSTTSAAAARAEFALAVAVRRAGPRRLAARLAARPSSSATRSSVRLMEHAATLDLEDFEDSELQDRLERARRQTSGRLTLIGPALRPGAGRRHRRELRRGAGGLCAVADRAAGRWRWCRPSSARRTSTRRATRSTSRRTPERRELDYVRQTGASVETAKEVKIFGLNALPDRALPRARRRASTRPTARSRSRRAGWGSVLTAIGTVGYYVAYAYIAWRTLHGDFSIGDLTFLAGSFRRLRTLLEGLLIGFSQVAGQALYLDDLFSFFEIRPEIVSPAESAAVPAADPRGLRVRGRRLPLSRRRALGGAPSRASRCSAGEVLALVGENGAGKTTLVKLLARLYDPDEGRILLDGHDLREYDLAALRAQHRRHLPGLRALPPHRRRQHRRRPHRGARRPCPHRARAPSAARPTR